MTNNVKITMLDILSILLPGGACMAILAQCYKVPDFDIYKHIEKHEWLLVAIILGTAYVLGHFIFLVASLLDSIIYDKVTRIFWNDNRLVAYIIELKTEISGISDGNVINAFKWSLAWLLENKPEMHAAVEHHVAESKFFRSLFVVLLFGSVPLFLHNEKAAFVLLCLSPLCLVRYLTQRRKAVETAYQFVIVASNRKFPSAPDRKILERTNSNNLYPYKQRDGIGVSSGKKRLLELYAFFRKVSEVLLLFVPGYRPSKGSSRKSWELRWFFKDESSAQSIVDWFEREDNRVFAHPRKMKDRYFKITKDKYVDLNVKLRGDNIEIKKKIEGDSHDIRISGKEFTKERWVRPRYPDMQYTGLMDDVKEGKYGWVEVEKMRLGFKVGPSGKLFPIEAPLERGCQVEYTRLQIGNTSYYTFALEWFGRSDTHFPEQLLEDIIGNTDLGSMKLCSYKDFIDEISTAEKG